MQIQSALRICLATQKVFARPAHWRGTGEAIDLACKVFLDRACKVSSLHTQAVTGSEWKVTPHDLLAEDWEIVSMRQLGEEVGRIHESETEGPSQGGGAAPEEV